VTTSPAQGQPILPHGHPFYVLIEAMGSDEAEDATRFERVLGDALEQGLVVDAVVAKSRAEAGRIWALRDDVGQMARLWPMFTFDVSLRIADMEEYVAGVRAALTARWPAARLVVFGHLGDGNLHLVAGVGDAGARHAVEEIVYGPLARIDGSISAEHGIGLQKRAYLGYSRSAEELDVMRALKHAFDPKGMLNPGKVVLAN
jgi:FAD/FMN-containing dehydrogenase